jgi:hypothetical protein
MPKMPSIDLDTILETDVLAKDVLVGDVCLFEAGTVLTRERVDILRKLKVTSVFIRDRDKRFYSLKELFANIDARFSHAEGNPTMRHIRMWLKDIISNLPAEPR